MIAAWCRYVPPSVTVSKKVSLFFFGLVLFNLAIGLIFFFGKQNSKVDLASPDLAITQLAAKSLYFTPSARNYLLAHRPDLLSAENKKDDSEQTRQFAQATQEVTLWRKLSRELQFDTVLLTGEPGEYRPLLQHLLGSSDWVLDYVDHTSLVFKHFGQRCWIPDDLKKVLEHFCDLSSRQRAVFLSQLSGKLLAVTQYAEAKRCLDQALELDKKSPELWTAKAHYELHFGQWPRALASAEKALESDENYLPALSAKTHLLFTLHRFHDALACSKRLLTSSPKNPQVLLLHAQIAHEAKEYSTEIEALLTIIELGENQGISTTGYRLLLAQSYAHNGEAVPALEQFHKTLQAADITQEQRQIADECIDSIQRNITPKADSLPLATPPAPVESR